LASLVKKIDQRVAKNGQLKSFVVLLNEDESAADQLQRLAQEAGVRNVPLTLYASSEGPPDYEINPEADITVLMWHGLSVKGKHAYKGELTDAEIEAIVADIPKVLGN